MPQRRRRVGAGGARSDPQPEFVRRLLPEIERFFQFKATRMDRYIVACYYSEVGGHFHRHRDNVMPARSTGGL